ncbi:hypothetical protein [Thermogutta sp.]|uniref:hypothetical protein n=1 Tax=Thermogutta sp. TaxID=1962930 RepID=UPI00321FFB52
MCSERIQSLIAQFREAVLENAQYSSRALTDPKRKTDPDKANRAHDRAHQCYKELRTTPEGRQAICDLMRDPDPYVRSAAAARALFWKPEEARQVLEELIEQGGILGFECELVLKEFDAGRLSFDY